MLQSNRVQAILLLLTIIVCASDSFASRPSKIYERLPSGVQLAYDSLNIPVPGGARLTAWLCKPKKQTTDQLIIISGPDAGNMGDQLDIAQALVANLGVRVLLFDYEGFGTSSPTSIDTDAIAMPAFADDLHAAIRFAATSLHVDSSKLIVYGRSMGASLAITVPSLYGGVAGIIAESPYVSQRSAAEACNNMDSRKRSGRRTKTIPSIALEPLSTADRCTAHLLLIYGELENLITSEEIFSLYSKIGSPRKSLWIASGARHLEVPYNELGTFLNAVASLLNSLQKHN